MSSEVFTGRVQVADRDIFRDLRNLYRMHQIPLTSELIERYTPYTRKRLSARFGGFKKSCDLAGVPFERINPNMIEG